MFYRIVHLKPPLSPLLSISFSQKQSIVREKVETEVGVNPKQLMQSEISHQNQSCISSRLG